MHSASYSAEDNKLRLYVGRVPRSDYERLRSAGFVSTPKQDCDFVATWTPGREDIALSFLGDDQDIEDEDYSPQERAADRAERFSGYRDKRASEAGVSADTFEAGPQAFGHQNAARAQRQADRHDRHRTRSVSQWSKAEYWQARTQGVISHALYKASASVRRSRILRLEAEQRKHEKHREEYKTRYDGWQTVLTLGGSDQAVKQQDGRPIGFGTPAWKLAYALANHGEGYWDFPHPRTGRKTSIYSLLTDPQDPITPAEAAALWLDGKAAPDEPDSNNARWSDHYNNRLTYERAMLAEEGGTAGDAEMVPGGFIRGGRTRRVTTDVNHGGWHQIQQVFKSPATGKVTSVKVWGTHTGFTPESNYRKQETRPCLVRVNVERLPEDCYRAPTPEELEAFHKSVKESKAKKKATTPKAPPLINPTKEDAQKLQDLWNAWEKEDHEQKRRCGECPISTILEMTQAQYSANSKGDYARFETSEISEKTEIRNGFRGTGGRVTVFKIRTASAPGYNYAARRVIVLTDKPQKPIPWNAVAEARAEQPTEADLFPRLEELKTALGKSWDQLWTEKEKKLIEDARYIGWAWSSSQTQKGMTEAGAEAYKRFQANPPTQEPAEEVAEETTAGMLF